MNKLIGFTQKIKSPVCRCIYNDLINKEEIRLRETIKLFTSDGINSCLSAKYSKERLHKRYYCANTIKKRAFEVFNLDKSLWDVNIRTDSGSVAVFNGLLNPGDTIMGLDLSHSFQTPTKKINFSRVSYTIKEDGYIDYDQIEQLIKENNPKLLICGGSAYPRDIEYDRIRRMCNCYMLADISHINGFIAHNLMNNPFEVCDIVTTTTHKTLRGPRSAMIFAKKENDLYKKISVQGGPHNHQIGALAFQLKEVKSQEYKKYITTVRENARYLGERLQSYGFDLSTHGTDCHLLLINLKPFNISGSKMERVCELANISLNKNTVYGDTSALSPSGIRIGTSCMTTRNMDKEGWDKLASWLFECVKICQKRQEKLKDFNVDIENDSNIIKLKEEIRDYASSLDFYNVD